MSLNQIVAMLLLAVTTVLALMYVSTFPVEGEAQPDRAAPAWRLESEKPATLPTANKPRPLPLRYDAETLRSMA